MDWSWPCNWLAEAAKASASAELARQVGDFELAEIFEVRAALNERIALGGVDGQREAIEGGYA